MFAETIAGLGAVKTAFDMAKALESIHETVARDRAIIDLQKEILAAQAAQFALLERVGKLEKEVTRLESWDAEKQRYQLTEIEPNIFARTLKEGMENGEPKHNLCDACYEFGFKSRLKRETWNPGRCNMLVCNGCGWFAYVHGSADPSHKGLRPTPYREG